MYRYVNTQHSAIIFKAGRYMSQIFLGHKQTHALSLTHGLKLLHLHTNIRTQTLKQTLAHGDTNIVDTDTCALTHSTLVLVLGHIHKTTLIHITHTLTHGHGHNKNADTRTVDTDVCTGTKYISHSQLTTQHSPREMLSLYFLHSPHYPI